MADYGLRTTIHMHIPLPTADNRGTRKGNTPNAALRIEVSRADLPLHCPMPGSTLWDSHPRVYIPLDQAHPYAVCPYCGTEYRLKD